MTGGVGPHDHLTHLHSHSSQPRELREQSWLSLQSAGGGLGTGWGANPVPSSHSCLCLQPPTSTPTLLCWHLAGQPAPAPGPDWGT